jgi:hypothetical protein
MRTGLSGGMIATNIEELNESEIPNEVCGEAHQIVRIRGIAHSSNGGFPGLHFNC